MDVRSAVRPLWGLHVPLYYGVNEQAAFVSREEHYGRPTLLLLAGRDAVAKLPSVIDGLRSTLPALSAQKAQVFLIVDQNPMVVRRGTALPENIAILDCGTFLQRCGAPATEVMALLLDRGQRVLLQWFASIDPAFVQRCPDLLAAQPSIQAPVLIRPALLPPEWCDDLINLFERSPSMEGEVARADGQGSVRSVVDHEKKRRRDMPIAEGTKRHALIVERLFEVFRPEIKRAFQVDVTHVDRVLLARYDAGAGWFRRHRDNTAEQVAFREFALSVNLNTGDYEGGDLHFPEYNDLSYSPPRGGGVVFSASMLHEVTPVRTGSRYALLTFMHSDAAEARRLGQGRSDAARAA